MEIIGKKISVVGARRSGAGAAKLIKKNGGIPFVSDTLTADKLTDEVKLFNELNIAFETGGNSEKVLESELIVVSPGVPSDIPLLQEAARRGIKVIGELELAASFCRGRIIAVTGTNGKTTTTSLIGHLFNNAGIKAFTAGNIGTAFSEVAEKINEDEFAVLEVSSFQLDLIEKFKPFIALILNITPDHLNRYDNKFENYIASKMRIFMNQQMDDYLVLNRDNENLINSLKHHSSKPYYFSLINKEQNGCYIHDNSIIYSEEDEVKFRCKVSDLLIRGEHNTANAMSAIIAAKLSGVNNESILEGLKSFKGIEHRLELVREIDGVKYINDSKATNVDSVWYALRSFDQPIFLILGGLDKGNDYNLIKDLIIDKVKKIYAIGSSADKIFNIFHSEIKVEIKASMEDAVAAANQEARENDIVLLSPACASFDMFQNYEHRGLVFKQAVNRL